MKMRFLEQRYAPDKGDASGGAASSDPNAQGAGADIDFFEGVDFDSLNEFDPETAAIIKKAKEGFATLQSSLADTKKTAAEKEKLAKQFQGDYDSLMSKVSKAGIALNGSTNGKSAAATLEDDIVATLQESGVAPEQAKAQGKLMGLLFEKHGNRLKSELGHDLGPMAERVMWQDAQNAFQQVAMQDRLGVFGSPELSQKIWSDVSQLTQNGTPVTPEVVSNLKRMHYAEYLESGGEPLQTQQMPQQQQPQQRGVPPMPQFFNPMQFGGHSAQVPNLQQSSADRMIPSDPDTKAALAATFAHMPIKPKAFGGSR